MICGRCIRRASALPRANPTRHFITTTRTLGAAGQTSNPRPNDHPAATSTGIAQPFSNPLADKATPSPKISKPKANLPVSSVPAGQPLKGLNFLKGRDDPVALKEEEYPEWLWRLLDTKTNEGAEDESAGDEFSKSKKQRRVAAKRKAKAEAAILASGDLSALAPKIPIQKQSIDLPWNEDGSLEGGLEAIEKREELRKAMRAERRAGIKEKNYLKSV